MRVIPILMSMKHDYANILFSNSYVTLRPKTRKPLSNSNLKPKLELLIK